MNTLLSWMPAPDVVDHYGDPLAFDLEFFAPPPEIGRVLTAFSTMRVGKSHPSLLKTVGRTLGVFAGMCVGGGAVGWVKGDVAGWVFAGGGVGLMVAGFVYWQSARAGQCTYVGDKGISRSFYSIYKSGMGKTETLVFEDAAYLLAYDDAATNSSETTGTSFGRQWKDANGNVLLTVRGSYEPTSLGKTGHPTNMEFGFADHAEDVWSGIALKRAQDELSKLGYALFPLEETGEARVGRDYVEVHAKNGITRFEGSNIAKLENKKGTVTLQARDAQKGVLGMGRHGIFTIKYMHIGNARLFLYLVNRLGGYETPPIVTANETQTLHQSR